MTSSRKNGFACQRTDGACIHRAVCRDAEGCLCPPDDYGVLTPAAVLPTDSQARKDTPIYSGVVRYFPLALAEIARLSKAGNDKHNPGQPLHWSRGKSNDHADCVMRHLLEVGTIDPDDGHRHATKLAWRALALLQLELEAAANAGKEAARLRCMMCRKTLADNRRAT